MMPGRRGRFAVLALLTAASWPVPGQAQPRAQGEALRVVVRVCDERDARALARLRGQTSDLPVTLIVREGDVLEPQFGEQLDRATALGRELGASAVVWFDSIPARDGGMAPLLVYVATPDSGRVLARQLGAPAGDGGSAPPESALLEQSALVVRFALEGLAVGGAIGVERGTALANAPAPASAPEPAAGRAAAVIPQPAVEAVPEREAVVDRARPVWLGLGYQVAADGLVGAHHGLAARVEVATPRLDLSIASSVSLPATHHEARADLRLQRVAIGAAVDTVWSLSPRLALAAGVQAGALAQHRKTLESEPQVVARPARWTTAFAFGPEIRLRYRVGTFGVSLGAVVDILLEPPRFVYRQAEREVQGDEAWSVQPRLVLSGEVAP